jgi:MFS family permease
LLAGVGCAALVPLELYVFYWFSEGGRFHYEGFGFGSFMFANMAAQIIGYCLIALVLIPLGYGHLKLRRWARTLSQTLLWFWLVAGIPIIVLALAVFLGSKDPSIPGVVAAVVALGLSYLAVPALCIPFYRGDSVRSTFERRDPRSYRLEERPQPVLVLSLLYVLGAAIVLILIFFRGVYPLFGRWLSGMAGAVLIDLSILWLLCLAWATLRQKAWAWWGGLTYLGLMAVNSIVTLAGTSYAELLARMDYPPTEMEALQGIPLQGYHLALLAGVPLVAATALVALSRRHFGARADN